MADPEAIRPLSIHRYPLGTVETRPEESVDPRPTLVPKTKRTSTRARAERGYGAARKTVLDAIADARRKLRYVADEKPLQLVLGVAVAAFLAGVGLRLWRSHYE